MWLKATITLVLIIIASFFAYSKYIESQKDIHELALAQQSNISDSRKPEETAIYRNTLVPFEMPLVSGLSIRQGFKIRNGNLKDIWSVVFDQKHNRDRFVFISNKDTDPLSLETVNGIMKRLTEFFVHNDSYTIGITVPLFSYHGFLTALTCFTNSLTLHYFNEIPNSQHEVDLLIINESQLNSIQNIKYKVLVIVGEDSKTHFKEGINWGSLAEFSELKDDKFDYKYDPKYDEGIPFLCTIKGQTNEFTHRNFVSSIASIVRTIPIGHELGTNDKLLVNDSNDFSNLSKVLAVLLFGGDVILNTSSTELDSLIIKHKPTIVATSPKSAKTILNYHIYFYSSRWNQLKLFRAENLLSEGIFTEAASSSLFKSIRLFYISSNGNNWLPSLELNKLRILTGARIITERFLPNVLGSILSSNFYDYRILSNNKITNRGAPCLSLEMKNFKYKDLDIEKRHGELCIRGFIIGKPHNEKALELAIKKGEIVGSEGWMPTGIIGKFGNDGCFYEDR